MFSLRAHRRHPVPTLILALGLFLFGGNFCVMSALAGDTRMPCLNGPAEAGATSVPACHGAAHSTDAGDEPPAAPSCCPQPVVAPVAPGVEKPAADLAPLHDAPLATTSPVVAPAAIESHGHRPAADGQPPPRLTRAPAPARAPPLA